MSSIVSHVFFRMANERDSELEACEYLDIFAKKCGFAPDTIDEMRLAFIEGLINAKEHAPKGISNGVSENIHIAFNFENDMITIQIRDFGQGFDPTVIEKPDIKKKLKSSNKRGWGLMLMERLMDGAEISSFPPSGTLVQLVKKRVSNETAEVDTMKEHRRNERLKYILTSFIDLSSFLCQSKDLHAGLRSMLRILLGTMGVSRGAIYTFGNSNDTLECFVDIKLRADAKLPKASITQEVFEKLASRGNCEVTDIIKCEISAFRDNFKDGEIEDIYVLRTDNQNQGLLVLGARFRKEDEETLDKELLTTIARNISSAINTFKLMQDLRSANENLDKKIDALNSVREASQAISSELEIDNIPSTVENIFHNIIKINKFSMMIYDPIAGRYSICQNGRELPLTLDMWSSHISQHVVNTMEPLFVPDIRCEDRFDFPRSGMYKSESFIVVPIVIQNEVLGLINITDKNDSEKLSVRDFELAQLLCSQLGIALKNANLYKKGITDVLTRLYTNHYFKVRLAQEFSRHRRVKAPLSIVMIAVDNLGRLVKKNGLSFRDETLVKVGSVIKCITRFNDLPCRYEGDNFAIIMPDTDAEGCRVAAKKIFGSLSNISIKHHNICEKLTVSMVTSEFEASIEIGRFIERIEACLNLTKEEGGNQIRNCI